LFSIFWHGIILLKIDVSRRKSLTIFSSIIAFGAVLGLIWIALDTPTKNRHIHLTAGVWVLTGALLGSRLTYVVTNWEYFQQHIFEIHQIWLGGMAWPGALAGGLLGFACRLADSLDPGFTAWFVG